MKKIEDNNTLVRRGVGQAGVCGASPACAGYVRVYSIVMAGVAACMVLQMLVRAAAPAAWQGRADRQRRRVQLQQWRTAAEHRTLSLERSSDSSSWWEPWQQEACPHQHKGAGSWLLLACGCEPVCVRWSLAEGRCAAGSGLSGSGQNSSAALGCGACSRGMRQGRDTAEGAAATAALQPDVTLPAALAAGVLHRAALLLH